MINTVFKQIFDGVKATSLTRVEIWTSVVQIRWTSVPRLDHVYHHAGVSGWDEVPVHAFHVRSDNGEWEKVAEGSVMISGASEVSILPCTHALSIHGCAFHIDLNGWLSGMHV